MYIICLERQVVDAVRGRWRNLQQGAFRSFPSSFGVWLVLLTGYYTVTLDS